MVSIDGPGNKCQRATGLPPGWLGNDPKKRRTAWNKSQYNKTTVSEGQHKTKAYIEQW